MHKMSSRQVLRSTVLCLKTGSFDYAKTGRFAEFKLFTTDRFVRLRGLRHLLFRRANSIYRDASNTSPFTFPNGTSMAPVSGIELRSESLSQNTIASASSCISLAICPRLSATAIS
jgi:hypothetical protein